MAALARRIALHAAISVVGRGVGIAITAVTFLFIARALGPERFGLYALAVVFVTMFSTVIDNGVNITVTRLLTERPDTAPRVLANGLVLKFAASAVLAAIAIAVAQTPWVDPRLREVLPIASGLILMTGFTVVNAFFQARLDMGWVVIGDLVSRAAFLALATLVLSGGGGVGALLAAQVGAAAAGAVVPAGRAIRLVGRAFEMDATIWRAIAGPALALSLSLALGIVTARFDAIALSTRVPDRELGLYAAAFRTIDLLQLVPGLVLQVVFPAFVHDTRATVASRYARVTGVLLIVGLPLAALLTTAAGPTLAATAGDAYRDGGRYLAVLAWGMVAVFLASAMLYVLVALKRFQALLAWSALGTVTSVALSLYLVPRFGASGAAAATVIAHTTVLLGLGIALAREGVSPLPALVPEAIAVAALVGVFARMALPHAGAVLSLLGAAGLGLLLTAVLPRTRRAVLAIVNPEASGPSSGAP